MRQWVQSSCHRGGRLSPNFASQDFGSVPFTFSPGFSLSPSLPLPPEPQEVKLGQRSVAWPPRAKTGSGAGAVTVAVV